MKSAPRTLSLRRPPVSLPDACFPWAAVTAPCPRALSLAVLTRGKHQGFVGALLPKLPLLLRAPPGQRGLKLDGDCSSCCPLPVDPPVASLEGLETLQDERARANDGDSVTGKTIRWIFGPMPNRSLYLEKLGASSLVSELGRQEHNFKNSQNRPPTTGVLKTGAIFVSPELYPDFLSRGGSSLASGPTDGRAAPNAAGTQALERRAVRFTAHREQKPRNGAHLTRGTSQRRVRRRSSPIPPRTSPPPPAIPIALLLDCFCSDPPLPPKAISGISLRCTQPAPRLCTILS